MGWKEMGHCGRDLIDEKLVVMLHATAVVQLGWNTGQVR